MMTVDRLSKVVGVALFCCLFLTTNVHSQIVKKNNNSTNCQIAVDHRIDGRQLLRNLTFAENARGWSLVNAIAVPANSKNPEPVIELNGLQSYLGAYVKPVPSDYSLHFSCRLYSETPAQKIVVNAFAYDSKDKILSHWTQSKTLDHNNWTRFGSVYVAPSGTARLAIFVINADKNKITVSRPLLTLGSMQKSRVDPVSLGLIIKAPEVAKIILAKYTTCVKLDKGATSGRVTFPIPGLYREQIPLTFQLRAEPRTAILSHRLLVRKDGRNWICEAVVKPPLSGVVLKWESVVLVLGRNEAPLPKMKPSYPSQVSEWTKSTRCVQSDDLAIRAKCEELSKGATDVESYARKVIEFTSKNQGIGSKFESLDAKCALNCGGSCTSRANLAAALLRARGIPSRTLSHLPVWATTPLYEHWLTEYWHPNVGWVWLEPTLGEFRPAPNTLVVLAVSNSEDEEKTLDSTHLRSLMILASEI